MNKEKLKKLYDFISPVFSIGDFETFLSKMDTKEKRKKFYEKITQEIDSRTGSKFDLKVSSFDEFEKKLTKSTTTKPKVKRIVPPELKNLENGIKKFQDWLDDYLPNWATGYIDGKINKGQNGGGYGTYGPRTEKAWKTEGIADKFMKFVSTGSNSNAGSSSNKPEEELENVFGRSWNEIISNN